MKTTVQHIPAFPQRPNLPGRPETGVMQFGDDWPGVFIRGDNAFAYAIALKHAKAATAIEQAVIDGLRDLLLSCDYTQARRGA